MFAKNNQLHFENVTCWRCEGSTIVTLYKPCPNAYKVVGAGKRCNVCGCKNKNSHNLAIESYKASCQCCDQGKIKEDIHSYASPEIFNEIPFEIYFLSNKQTLITLNGDRTEFSALLKSLEGNLQKKIGGYVDYGRKWGACDEAEKDASLSNVMNECLDECKKSLKNQVCNYIHPKDKEKENPRLPNKIIIIITPNGVEYFSIFDK